MSCPICGATEGSEVCFDGRRYRDDCPILADMWREDPECVPAANRANPNFRAIVAAEVRAQRPGLADVEVERILDESVWTFVDGKLAVDLRLPPVAQGIEIEITKGLGGYDRE